MRSLKIRRAGMGRGLREAGLSLYREDGWRHESPRMDMEEKEGLLKRAAAAAGRAYAPYSRFTVGAALRTRSGRIFEGCNVENASYGLTICAERVAVFKAVSEGEREFDFLALSAPGGASPCGACRQVLREFAPDLLVLLGDENGRMTGETSLALLLPESFGPDHLQREGHGAFRPL